MRGAAMIEFRPGLGRSRPAAAHHTVAAGLLDSFPIHSSNPSYYGIATIQVRLVPDILLLSLQLGAPASPRKAQRVVHTSQE